MVGKFSVCPCEKEKGRAGVKCEEEGRKKETGRDIETIRKVGGGGKALGKWEGEVRHKETRRKKSENEMGRGSLTLAGRERFRDEREGMTG